MRIATLAAVVALDGIWGLVVAALALNALNPFLPGLRGLTLPPPLLTLALMSLVSLLFTARLGRARRGSYHSALLLVIVVMMADRDVRALYRLA